MELHKNRFEVDIILRTEKAILVEKPSNGKGYDDSLSGKPHHKGQKWIPLSLVKIEIGKHKKYKYKITIPNWLAVKYYWAKKESGFYTFNNYDDDYSRDPEFLYDWHHN